MNNKISNQQGEREHSACGVGMIVKMDDVSSHELVDDGLAALAQFEYRSGYNLVTQESDGAGIKFFGLSAPFFTKKIQQGEFKGEQLSQLTLKEGQFALGQFFLPTNPQELSETKALIEQCARAQGLKVVAWRNLDTAVNDKILSAKANQKKPALFQSLILPEQNTQSKELEQATLAMGVHLDYEAHQKNAPLHMVSLSSESITYKGMLRPSQLAQFYLDLQDKDFTAKAVILHARYATNTDPQWANAQPCRFFWAHNGELNSAPGNAVEMTSELTARDFKGIYPNSKLSDSMQFDADLANQIVMHQIQLDEALMRLMAPNPNQFSAEISAMIRYWALQRTPYNGPAFAVAGMGNCFMAKLDSMGLRPSRWAITKDKLIAGSDDFLDASQHQIIQKGHLEPGGMLVVTPDKKVLHTKEILAQIATRYQQGEHDYFQKRMHQSLVKLPSVEYPEENLSGVPLQRLLYSAGWDYESESQVVRFMAEHGYERTGAMGDDTSMLHTAGVPAHISYFFHQLFAQVSAPPLDSIKERDRFSLTTFLGGVGSKNIELASPILHKDELHQLEQQTEVPALVIDTSFLVPDIPKRTQDAEAILSQSIQNMLRAVEKITTENPCGVLILSDRKAGAQHALIPDLIAVAAVRRFLEIKHLDRQFGIVSDSYQIHGPHQASTLLALGAKAVYPRGAYAKIVELFPANPVPHLKKYNEALQKCLLKTMGKMGITDVNNYINSGLVAAVGLDLTPHEKNLLEAPSLATVFPGIYSPLKGINLGHIAQGVLTRHQQAYDPEHPFNLLPRSGYYMQEKNGIQHGFGPVVINAFTEWMKQEDLRARIYQMHLILERKGFPNFIANPDSYTTDQGFLDPRYKNSQGFYPPAYLEQFTPSSAFKKYSDQVDDYRRNNPTALHDYFTIKTPFQNKVIGPMQSQQDIRSLLFAGSMSQGALTVSDPKTPNRLGAHETLTRGMNAIGANSASGEGGEALDDLSSRLNTTRSKQFASGRFGISAEQILNADEIEIKIAQGAKPGEGGELPGHKVSIRFAAQRGGLPHMNFISPPPHHDIYSIEDLEELIHDIKSVNPKAKVAVKLVASQGIGTIAVGVAKAGADVINIASNSGGTGAAQQSSIKHAGLPFELGLAEVDRALRKTGLRDLVALRVSGGFKTAEEVILAAILGADLFEFGTTAMLTLGCKMQRTCNQSCQPGVATDGHLFKGNQINTERYFVNIAAAIQERLKELGFNHMTQLRGRTDLLELIDPQSLALYDFSALLDRSNLPKPLSAEQLAEVRAELNTHLERPKEDALSSQIKTVFNEKEELVFNSKPIDLNTQDRSFGARIVGNLTPLLKKNPNSNIVIHTQGNAGQSFAFVNAPGITIKHTGTVQDGCGKSMTGGTLILCTPKQSESYQASENTIAGNAMLYGASGGNIFVNGQAGHRFGILMKGAEVVVEGVGDLAFEYMTSGTGMILGNAGKGLGAGASGGILFAYDPNNSLHTSDSLRTASIEERSAYQKAIQGMLKEHLKHTNSKLAKKIIENFDVTQFKVLIPKEMDKINSLREILDVIATYQLRKAPITCGLKVWLEQKTLSVLRAEPQESKLINELRELIHHPDVLLFSSTIKAQILQLTHQKREEQFDVRLPIYQTPHQAPKIINSIDERLMDINGHPDHSLLDALKHIQSYVFELSHSAQGCSGCRAQSCSGNEHVDSGCPSGKGVNTINALLKQMGPINPAGVLTTEQWKYLRQAFAVQTQESPFIAYTGAACPAPCQDACTETIPDHGAATLKRGGKPVGEYVHIKDIEYYLYQIGRSLGWFDGNKTWTKEEIAQVFGGMDAKQAYDKLMLSFIPPFKKPAHITPKNKELIIIGSGPAAMQMAYKALMDGVQVRMYEKSDKPGGLLMDGIPSYKFDKTYLTEDFLFLHNMGLELHLSSEVFYDAKTKAYRIKGKEHEEPIAFADNENQYIALCIGAGEPKTLSSAVLNTLKEPQRQKIIQATDFIKAANDLASELKQNPSLPWPKKEALISHYFGSMDPRNKKIVVLGGGDTAQDVIRWITRYFNQEGAGSLSELNILVRGPQISKRAILDGYPTASRAPTHENMLKKAEVEYVQGTERYLVELVSINTNPKEKLKLAINKSRYKYTEQIQNDSQLTSLFESLPREARITDPKESSIEEIDDVDLIICALGFQGNKNNSLVQFIEKHDLKNVYLAGDAAGTGIIVAAQDNANKIYGQIRAAMGIDKMKMSQAFGFFAGNYSEKTGQGHAQGLKHVNVAQAH